MQDEADNRDSRLGRKSLRFLVFGVVAACASVVIVANAWDGEVRIGRSRHGKQTTISREKSPDLFWIYLAGMGGCTAAAAIFSFVLAYRMHKRTFDPDDPKWKQPHWYRKAMEKRSAGDVSNRNSGGKT